ncbi:unnamed protein product [Alternaria alternata]
MREPHVTVSGSEVLSGLRVSSEAGVHTFEIQAADENLDSVCGTSARFTVESVSDDSTYESYTTIGGLVLVDGDLFAITTAHAITKHGIPDPQHIVTDRIDDSPVPRDLDMLEWKPSPFPNTFAYLGDAYVRGVKVDRPLVDAADFALVEPQSFPKLGFNTYQLVDRSHFESVSDYTPTKELKSGDVTICTNDDKLPMKGIMVEGDAPIIIKGAVIVTRMIEVTTMPSPGLSGSWVVREGKLCGVVYAGSSSIPYLYIIPAEIMLENVKKLLGAGTVRVATAQNISTWKLQNMDLVPTFGSSAYASSSSGADTRAPQQFEETSLYGTYQVGDLVRINAPVAGGPQEVYTVSDGWVDRKGNTQYTLQRQSIRIAQKNCTVLTLKALEGGINVSLPYTRKLRSSATMDNNPDTQRVRARLNDCGTPQEIAEEGFRVCHVYYDPRAELDKVKKAAATAALAHSSAVSAFMAVSTLSTAGTIPIVQRNTAVPTSTISAIPPQGQPRAIKALKNKIAVMEDALAEMRNEAPKMRECMAWMWDIIGKECMNHIPKQLKDMYHETMVVDLVDWQPNGRVKGGKGKDDLKNTKGKEEVKVKKERASAADNVVAGVKRRGISPLGKDAKKIKFEQREV